MNDEKAKEQLQEIGKHVQHEFAANKRVLSFAEYIALVRAAPTCHLRNAAQYVRDLFDHYGVSEYEHPTGRHRRFKLFDVPWNGGRGRLVGQEAAQNKIYRILNNFVRQGRVDRFVLLHGPNGSSKSTIIDIIAQAMEHYSSLDEGALYRFNWIFPNQGVERAGIGFGGKTRGVEATESYAHLDDSAIDARMPCELRDHPMLLIPRHERRELMERMLRGAPGGEDFPLSDYLLAGDLSHKSKEIYEALLAAYEGDYLRVLRHVQVERFYVSRRYRLGTSRVEPQMAVDARTRQVTADRSLAALPSALQNLSLHETEGEIVRANRGLIDFADLFKRPLEAYRYLLTAVEDGRVALGQTNLFLDLIFIGSANETHLNAFMESHEWTSFKARMELVRVPYLRDFRHEQAIYDDQITASQAGKPIAPHATAVAALWAVLSRMHKPDINRYDGPLRDLVSSLTPVDKVRLYSDAVVPDGLDSDAAKLLRSNIGEIFRETESQVLYEGRTGASVREVKTAIMNAAQNPDHACLSPEAVLGEIEQLVKETSVYDFLRQDVQTPGYYDHRGFIDIARTWYLDIVDDQVRSAMGLVEESSYAELFGRYVDHVTHYVRKEKLRNPVTGAFEEPDPRLMSDVEGTIGIDGEPETFRQSVMTRIGAWSLDNPGEKPDYVVIFPEMFERLRDRYFAQQHQRVERLLKGALQVLGGDESQVVPDDREPVRQMLQRLEQDYGYCEECMREVLTVLVRHRNR